jgi:hypothetical protein
MSGGRGGSGERRSEKGGGLAAAEEEEPPAESKKETEKGKKEEPPPAADAEESPASSKKDKKEESSRMPSQTTAKATHGPSRPLNQAGSVSGEGRRAKRRRPRRRRNQQVRTCRRMGRAIRDRPEKLVCGIASVTRGCVNQQTSRLYCLHIRSAQGIKSCVENLH